MLYRPNSDKNYLGLLVKKLCNIKIKMYQERSHSMPHIHIDYGNERHVASYSIQSHERLVGNLDRKYDVKIKSWIKNNQSELLNLWENTQNGKAVEAIISEIQGNL